MRKSIRPGKLLNTSLQVVSLFGCRPNVALWLVLTSQNNRIYFPQNNNPVFLFGRDVNLRYKHGINALAAEDQDGKGRISIVLWGLAQNVIEEEGSPALLGSDGKGPHANHKRRNRGQRRRNNSKSHCDENNRAVESKQGTSA